MAPIAASAVAEKRPFCVSKARSQTNGFAVAEKYYYICVLSREWQVKGKRMSSVCEVSAK